MVCPNCSTRYSEKTTLCPTCSSNDSTRGTPCPKFSASCRLIPGTLLADRYRIIDALGRGGMGEVYRAEDLKLGEFVALKFLPESVSTDERKLAMFLEEARTARRVSHGNVCRVFDVGVHPVDAPEQIHFISMEYIDGETLASLLRRIGPLPKTKALEIAEGLCRGLAAVHEMGVVHRDIKPSNIMIDGEGRVRWTDFGLATSRLDSETGQGGTPAYMAPERFTEQAATVRSDLYAFGLVLYELFTGHRAFRARSPREYAWLHLETRPEPPSKKVPEVDPEVERIILRCLEKVPARRPASANALASALAKVDPKAPTVLSQEAEGEMLRALLICELDGRTSLTEALGDRQAVELWRKHDRLARDLLAAHEGREIEKADRVLSLFEHPLQAVRFALAYHEALQTLPDLENCRISARMGIHFGEVWLRENTPEDVARGAKPLEVDGLAKADTARVMSLADRGQTLLSRAAFDLARRSAVGLDEFAALQWLDHGSWRLEGVADPIDIFEVGHEGCAPLSPPKESDQVRRLLIQPRVAGWRPAPGLTVPQRRHWQVERRLGGGGFGEVWLAKHVKTGEVRGFKFCFDAKRLQALKREITLFRLLKEELGVRDDINRILDWNLDEAPYFIESEYTRCGSLPDWIADAGGIEAIPLETRLEIVAQVATALAAAHSIGVLHKDVKPSNVLIQPSDDGVQALLADFGIGQITQRDRLAEAGITLLGMSETFEPSSSPASGTRLYMAPELLEDGRPTLQADIYALGVMLYQLVVGDLGRAIAPGWRRDVADELLIEDIAYFADRSPELRPASAHEVAQRLRSLEERRREHQAKVEAQKALDLSQRRRKIYKAVSVTFLIALVLVSIFAVWAVQAGQKERHALEAITEVISFFSRFSGAPKNRDGIQDLGDIAVEDRDLLFLTVQRRLEHHPVVQAQVMYAMGRIYRSWGDHHLAAVCFRRSFAIWRQFPRLEHPEEMLNRQWTPTLQHPESLALIRDLASDLHALGDYSRARQLHEQALKTQQRTLGLEHPENLALMKDLASDLRALGDFSRVETLQEQMLEILQTLGPEHPTLGLDLSDLRALGDFSRVIRLLEQELKTLQQGLGPEHRHTLLTLRRLGDSFWEAGDLTKAKQLHEQVVEANQRTLGLDHRDTLYSMGSLATTLSALGDILGAKQLREHNLEMRQRTLGPEHRGTLVAMNNLAVSFWEIGDFSRARRLHEQTLKRRQRVLGAEHPHTVGSMRNLAMALRALGDLPRAQQLLERVLASGRNLGLEHRPTLDAMSGLARVLHDLGNHGRARTILEEVVEMADRVFGAEHYKTLSWTNDLSTILQSPGDVYEVRKMSQQALETSQRVLGDEHPITVRSKHNLAIARYNIGELDAAKALLEQAFDSRASALGVEHPDTTETARWLLTVSLEQENALDTKRWLEKLGWLTDRDEENLPSASLRKVRTYVLDVLATRARAA